MVVEKKITKDRRTISHPSRRRTLARATSVSLSRGSGDHSSSAGTSSNAEEDGASLESTYSSMPKHYMSRSYSTPNPDLQQNWLAAPETQDAIVPLRMPPNLRSDDQTRDQMMERFYDLHIGNSHTARRVFAFEALDTKSETKSATKAAMDTLCVAQIASTFHDTKLKGQARSMYLESLQKLGSQVERLSPKRPPNMAILDDVIGALHALTSCAFFTCCTKAEELDWMHYTQTTLKILEVFGWDALSPLTKHAYYYNWKYRAFFEGLTRRTKVNFTEPSDMDPVISAPGLAELAFDVPGLLWRADRFVEAAQSNAISSYMVVRLLTEIGACMSRLKLWFLNWMKDQPRALHYRTIATRNFPGFRLLCGEHLNTFPLAYDFVNAGHVRDLRTYSLCMIKLDDAIIQINAAFPAACDNEQLKIQLRQAQFDAETSAADLCMLLPWCTQPQNMAFSAVHSFMPLHFAATYYAKQGKVRQLAWCRKVSRSLVEKYGIDIRYPN